MVPSLNMYASNEREY